MERVEGGKVDADERKPKRTDVDGDAKLKPATTDNNENENQNDPQDAGLAGKKKSKEEGYIGNKDELSLPISLLVHIAQFISHRRTYNNLALASKEVKEALEKVPQPPWPASKLSFDVRREPANYVHRTSITITSDSENIVAVEPRDYFGSGEAHGRRLNVFNARHGPKKFELTAPPVMDQEFILCVMLVSFTPDGNCMVFYSLCWPENRFVLLYDLRCVSGEGTVFDPTKPPKILELFPPGEADQRAKLVQCNVLSTKYGAGAKLQTVFQKGAVPPIVSLSIALWDIETGMLLKSTDLPAGMKLEKPFMYGEECILWVWQDKIYAWNYEESEAAPQFLPYSSPDITISLSSYLRQNPTEPTVFANRRAIVRETHESSYIAIDLIQVTGSKSCPDAVNVLAEKVFACHFAAEDNDRDRVFARFELDWFPDGHHLFYTDHCQKAIKVMFVDIESGETQPADESSFPARLMKKATAVVRDITKKEGQSKILTHIKLLPDGQGVFLKSVEDIARVVTL